MVPSASTALEEMTGDRSIVELCHLVLCAKIRFGSEQIFALSVAELVLNGPVATCNVATGHLCGCQRFIVLRSSMMSLTGDDSPLTPITSMSTAFNSYFPACASFQVKLYFPGMNTEPCSMSTPFA